VSFVFKKKEDFMTKTIVVKLGGTEGVDFSAMSLSSCR